MGAKVQKNPQSKILSDLRIFLLLQTESTNITMKKSLLLLTTMYKMNYS